VEQEVIPLNDGSAVDIFEMLTGNIITKFDYRNGAEGYTAVRWQRCRYREIITEADCSQACSS
jgi:hypothetical protein